MNDMSGKVTWENGSKGITWNHVARMKVLRYRKKANHNFNEVHNMSYLC
jgi:hypothetical protein